MQFKKNILRINNGLSKKATIYLVNFDAIHLVNYQLIS